MYASNLNSYSNLGSSGVCGSAGSNGDYVSATTTISTSPLRVEECSDALAKIYYKDCPCCGKTYNIRMSKLIAGKMIGELGEHDILKEIENELDKNINECKCDYAVVDKGMLSTFTADPKWREDRLAGKMTVDANGNIIRKEKQEEEQLKKKQSKMEKLVKPIITQRVNIDDKLQ